MRVKWKALFFIKTKLMKSKICMACKVKPRNFNLLYSVTCHLSLSAGHELVQEMQLLWVKISGLRPDYLVLNLAASLSPV